MKIMRFLLVCVFCTATFFISSDVFSQARIKHLIGTWKPVKVEKYNILKDQAPAPNSSNKEKAGATEDKTSTSTIQQGPTPDKLVTRSIQLEERSLLTLNADKTAIRNYRGKDIHANWKLTKHDTRLTVRNKESGKIMNLDVLRVNDTLAVVISHYSFGDLKITYKKDKSVK